jgi:Zn-finger nucleic acid-binding protein
MALGRTPESVLVCPLCSGSLETWARGRLFVEFCDQCSGLFLDRGELFDMFRSEGYRCPPEALLRHDFAAAPGPLLRCPKCSRTSLVPGTLQGFDVWHCTPCNGFFVDRTLVMGPEKAEGVPLDRQGFRRAHGPGSNGEDSSISDYLSRILDRMVFWEASVEKQD